MPNDIKLMPLDDSQRAMLNGMDKLLPKIQNVRDGSPDDPEIQALAESIGKSIQNRIPDPSTLGNAARELNETEKGLLAFLEEMKRQGKLFNGTSSKPKADKQATFNEIVQQPTLNITLLEDLTAREVELLEGIKDELVKLSNKVAPQVNAVRAGSANTKDVEVIRSELNKVNEKLGETLELTDNKTIQDATLSMADALNRVDKELKKVSTPESSGLEDVITAIDNGFNKLDSKLVAPKIDPQRLEGIDSDVKSVLKMLGESVPTTPQPIPASPNQPLQTKNEKPKAVQPMLEPAKGPSNMFEALAAEFSENTAQTVRSVIPDTSTMIDALTTNSPALRAVVGIARGLKGTRDRAKQRIVKPQQEVPEISKGDDGEPTLVMPDPTPQNKPEMPLAAPGLIPQPMSTEDMGRIEEINIQQLRELEKMAAVWVDDTGNQELAQQIHEDNIANTEAVEQSNAKLVEELERQTEAQQALLDIEQNRERDSDYKATESLGLPQVSETAIPVGPDGEPPEESNMGAFGAIGMLVGGLSSLGASIMGVVGKVLPMIGKVGRLLRVGPLALLSALWDFGSGFFNAEEILDKADVTITDRIQAGLSNVLGGLGRIVDMVAGWFGFDTGLGEILQDGFINLTQPVFDFFNNIGDKLTANITGDMTVVDAVKQFIPNLVDAVKYTFNTVIDFYKSGFGMVTDVISSGWENLKVYMNDKWTDWVVTPITQMGVDIGNWFGKMRDSVTGSVANMVNSVRSTFAGWVDTVKSTFTFEGLGDIGTRLTESVSGMFNSVFERIGSFVGGEGNDETDSATDEGISQAIQNLPRMINGFFSGVWNSMLDKISEVVDTLPDMLVPDSVKEMISESRIKLKEEEEKPKPKQPKPQYGSSGSAERYEDAFLTESEKEEVLERIRKKKEEEKEKLRLQRDMDADKKRKAELTLTQQAAKDQEKVQRQAEQAELYAAAQKSSQVDNPVKSDVDQQSTNLAMQNNVNNSRVTNNSYVKSTLTTDNPRINRFRAQSLLAGT